MPRITAVSHIGGRCLIIFPNEMILRAISLRDPSKVRLGGFMDLTFVTADEREKLYEEVWNEPVTTVAKRYGISDNGLRKHCKRLGIPFPPRGYWAKVNAGHKAPKTPLPKVTGDLRKYVRNYVIKYRADMSDLPDKELMTDEALSLLSEETKSFIKEQCSKAQVKKQLRNPHRLINEHREEIIYRKQRGKVLKRAGYNASYYSKVRTEYRANKAVLPINVSDASMNRAYRILDALMTIIEDMEGHTNTRLDSDKDSAYFVIMRSLFQFEIKEDMKKGRSAKENSKSTGKLIMILDPRSWFSDSISDKLEYKDGDEPLENQIGTIIYDMFVVANRLLAVDELKDREEKRKWEERQRQQRLEKMRKGELEEIRFLQQAASDWDIAERIRRFANTMELKIAEVQDEAEKEKLFGWLKWARDKADWLDPLCGKEDELLGRSQHIFDLIRNMDI